MVLHHITHRARLVVIGPAALDPYGFGHGDLHMVDVLRLPDRLEQNVGKAHGHQVLHRLFAQVMVDPVNLRFVEILSQGGIQSARADQVAAKGFFQNDPAPRVGDLVHVQALGRIVAFSLVQPDSSLASIDT